MKRTRNMLAARAERRAAAWRARNANLFADNLEQQLTASLAAVAVTRPPQPTNTTAASHPAPRRQCQRQRPPQ